MEEYVFNKERSFSMDRCFVCDTLLNDDNMWVCKIICVNHHRLFDTPVSCIMHNGFDNTVISWKKLVEKFLGGNDYVTGN